MALGGGNKADGAVTMFVAYLSDCHTYPLDVICLRVRINAKRSWLSMYFSETTVHCLARCQSFSGCFQTKLRARPILSAHDGAAVFPASMAGRWVTPPVLQPVQEYFVAGNISVKPGSLQEPS